MISAPDGQVPIEGLHIGDMVNTPIGPRRIVADMIRDVGALVDVEIDNGAMLRCTPEHAFFVVGLGFVRADALQRLDMLMSSSDWRPSTALDVVPRVAAVRPAGSGTVYNIEVAQVHCYYAAGVLVSY